MYREPNSPPLSLWEELERRLQESGLDEFHGRTGWVRCEPYQYHTALGIEQAWIWIRTPQGTATVTMLPRDSLDDLWVRFTKQVEPLRTFGFFQRNSLKDTRTVAEAPTTLALPETLPLPDDVTHVLQVFATSEGRNSRVLVDPVLHRAPPGEAYMERFRLFAESKGMHGCRVGLRALLVK